MARETVFWPGINDDIQRKVSQCQVCQENSSSLQQETMQSHEVPKAPWTKVGIDLFEYNKQQYLLVVDYNSKFPYTRRLHSPNTSTVINKLKEIFAENGIPETVITDGRPQFRSEFKEFAKKWRFQHIQSSPHHHQSNGQAERFVQTQEGTRHCCPYAHYFN